MRELNCEEKELMEEVLLKAIKNGNTVNPEPFKPTPKQYKMLHSIMGKLELSEKD